MRLLATMTVTLWSGAATAAQAQERDALAGDLTPSELACAMSLGGPGGRGVVVPRWPSDTLAFLLGAGTWNREGHGEPAVTLRYYCAALAFGLPDSTNFLGPVQVLRTFREKGSGVSVDFLREAGRRWPRWSWVWRELVATYAYGWRGDRSAAIRAALDAGRQPPLPAPEPDGCTALQRTPGSRGRAPNPD